VSSSAKTVVVRVSSKISVRMVLSFKLEGVDVYLQFPAFCFAIH